MNARTLLATALLLAAACGDQNVSDDAATLNVSVVAEGVDLRPYAANETAEILNSVRPVSLQFFICDKIKLTEQITEFCSLKAENYNYEKRISINGNTGTHEIKGYPPARDQVIIAQGIAANDKVTYQGFVTLPVIEPRGVYSVALPIKQTAYPPLPAPNPPKLIEPASAAFTVPNNKDTFVFKGTREPDTYIRINLPEALGLGPFRDYSKTNLPEYEETEFEDEIEWSFTVDIIDLRQSSFDKSYVFSFSAALKGGDKFSENVKFTLTACAVNGGDC